ncbi:UbiE/COQ5 methyltransferase [Gemmata obscuriglobus]|nr:bifunctional demethylmenaquinone methyltransferase/2-methoxy-6-polyprenyl-1,4-benzoquinol methylase UbiE [Gemmata obscuriglobus]QEG30658.1 UbiE/COQ5 methyltransferase [Gemmata obscuriglobus]VTS09985.1 ubiquinone menaquinone biosynthesis methyltransferase : Demethylmenaquinone methyltransferase OS=Singulisphaera acidiphila (strain ATCC BAA-1392 / DSM 18658 / VKM B-2454 / MOB10) GN=menG PE=3 SV=1: Ubie_methyltran [Gemmata obscuriglobus UQM 2246]
MPSQLLDKREVRIRRMFDQIAHSYDLLNHLLSLNIDRAWRNKTAKLVPAGPPEQGPILDLCTGTGDLAFTYDRVTKGAVPVVGADFSREMLTRAAKKAAAAGAGERVRFVEADAQALPFADGAFQLVTNAFGLRNITDTDKGLAEMVRVTRPGGRVAVLEFSKPRNPLLGRLYNAYFRYLLPLLGQFISGSRENAYRYLPASVLKFPDYDALAEKMRAAGLTEVRYEPFTFGVATLYVGVKPGAPGA